MITWGKRLVPLSPRSVFASNARECAWRRSEAGARAAVDPEAVSPAMEGRLLWLLAACAAALAEATAAAGATRDYSSARAYVRGKAPVNNDGLRANLVELPTATGSAGASESANCWKPCGKTSGPCEDFCGAGGKCCRKGFRNGENGCLPDEGGTRHHICVGSEEGGNSSSGEMSMDTLSLYIPSSVARHDARRILRAPCQNENEDLSNNFMQNPWLFCGCTRVVGVFFFR